jgi:hypothetical protein
VRQELLAAAHLAAVAHEDLEHRELARRQLDAAPPTLARRVRRSSVRSPTRSTVGSATPSALNRTLTRASSSSKRNGFLA